MQLAYPPPPGLDTASSASCSHLCNPVSFALTKYLRKIHLKEKKGHFDMCVCVGGSMDSAYKSFGLAAFRKVLSQKNMMENIFLSPW